MATEMTPQERAAAPVEVRQALADKVKNLIVSNLTHEENQLWLANVDAFEERAYQRGRRAALLEAAQVIRERAEFIAHDYDIEPIGELGWFERERIVQAAEDFITQLDRLAQEG